MKAIKFKHMAAQGDVMFKKIDLLPCGIVESALDGTYYIVAHSETGHSHVIDKAKFKNAKMLIDKTNDFIAYLQVGDGGAILEHLRSFDTHQPLEFAPGIYEIRRQREYTPEGFRKAQD